MSTLQNQYMPVDPEANSRAAPPSQTPSRIGNDASTEDVASEKEIKDTATAKKQDLQHNYQIIAVVSTLLAAVASTLLTPIGNENNYRRYSSIIDPGNQSNPVSLRDLSDRLLAACYTSLILSIEATCLTCYLKYRLSTLTNDQICHIWRNPDVNIGRAKRARRCLANYEIRALSLIFWFCFVAAILLIIGTILVYMYWQLPPVWFYIWSAFSTLLLILFLPLLTLRLYRTLTGTDYAY